VNTALANTVQSKLESFTYTSGEAQCTSQKTSPIYTVCYMRA